jgi:hypothetical protein
MSVEVAIRPGTLISRRPFPACCARGRVRDLTGFLAIRPMPLPCSNIRPRPSRQDLAGGGLVDAALGTSKPKASAGLYIVGNTGLQHLLSTLHERRRRLPCKTRFRLAGCAFTERGSNPLDRFERFQVT